MVWEQMNGPVAFLSKQLHVTVNNFEYMYEQQPSHWCRMPLNSPLIYLNLSFYHNSSNISFHTKASLFLLLSFNLFTPPS